jgi:diacylglycerol kinase family enzyme
VLEPGDDLGALAREAVGRGADVIGMAGGDGSQAVVVDVAMGCGVAFVCVPTGTRNHLAMDLGLDRADVVGALDAFGNAVERRIDLGMAGERIFVNNATAGLYAKIVQSPAYREDKVGTTLQMVPELLGRPGERFDLQYTGPDGAEHQSAHLILVGNGRYDFRGDGFGSRRRMDAGSLGIVAATFNSANDVVRFVQTRGSGRRRRPAGWLEWTADSFELRSNEPVEFGIDGEATILQPPILFRSLPGALRVRIPHSAPGYSPAAAAPTRGRSAITALLHIAAGRPVAIEA